MGKQRNSSSIVSLKSSDLMAAPTHINWDKVDNFTPAGRKDLSDAITEYFTEVRKASEAVALKTTQSGHLSNLPRSTELDLRFYAPRLDLGVNALFQDVNRTRSKNPTYAFANVGADAIIFEQAAEGEPAKLRTVKDSAAGYLSSVTYHGGLGISDEADRFDEYDVFDENIRRVPAAWNNTWSNNLATLVQALGAGVNETWDTDLIKTLNSAATQIFDDVGDTYGLSDSEPLALVYNGKNAEKVTQALVSELTLANDNNSKRKLEYDITPIRTRRVPAGTMYLALPGFGSVDVLWDDLYSEYGRDYKRGVDAQVFRSRRNAAISNTAQFRRITLA